MRKTVIMIIIVEAIAQLLKLEERMIADEWDRLQTVLVPKTIRRTAERTVSPTVDERWIKSLRTLLL